MIFDGSAIKIDVFYSAEKTGSPQILHLYATHEAMHSAFENYTVTDELDHSFVYFEATERAFACWKNKAGPIQFCGSAAYALAWLAITQFAAPALRITSRHISTTATLRPSGILEEHGLLRGDVIAEAAVVMIIPSQKTQLLFADIEGSLFFSAESGVYLLNTGARIERIDYPWIAAYMRRKKIKNAHGFCVFNWHRASGSGEVRYFVPWYGRTEDYVTGSIHQYLTPLVHEYFSAREQIWHQLSATGGCLLSRYETSRVLLAGQCRLADAIGKLY